MFKINTIAGVAVGLVGLVTLVYNPVFYCIYVGTLLCLLFYKFLR